MHVLTVTMSVVLFTKPTPLQHIIVASSLDRLWHILIDQFTHKTRVNTIATILAESLLVGGGGGGGYHMP